MTTTTHTPWHPNIDLTTYRAKTMKTTCGKVRPAAAIVSDHATCAECATAAR